MSDANYDLQKLVVVIAVECAAVPPSGHLSRSELVAWYNAEATARGLPATDSNVAAWIAGHRLGVGAFVEPTERALRYQQLYEIDNATLEMLLVAVAAFRPTTRAGMARRWRMNQARMVRATQMRHSNGCVESIAH
jgi:hypothetical protein